METQTEFGYTRTVVLDRELADELRRDRAVSGADRFDEVWEGEYKMSPIADAVHQELASGLASVFRVVADDQRRGKSYAGVNVSDRIVGWDKNFRVPDVAVYLRGTTATRHRAFWCGGPDFAVEVVSEDDESYNKFDFYAKIATKELLILDRFPWKLELYRLEGDQLKLVGVVALDDGQVVTSEVLPRTFELRTGEERPEVILRATDGDGCWTV